MKTWDLFLENLESELGKENVDRWLRTLKVIRFDAANLYLAAQDSFQIDWFEEHIRPRIRGKFYNNNFRPIAVHISTPKENTQPQPERPDYFSIQPDPLDPEFTIENFLPFPQNQIARQLALEVEKKTFNPLLFYGPKGCGKTHLLTAAAHLLVKKGLKVFFVNAEKFTEHVVSAIRLQKMQEFRKVYREIDALIIDDIQGLKDRAATQEEFFHTFNAFHTAGKYILLSSQKAPSQLNGIEPRLISRFEWGISISIEVSPTQALLEKKAQVWNMTLSQEMISWLTTAFPADPLTAFHTLAVRSKGHPVTLESAKIILKDRTQAQEAESVTPEKIIKSVASHYGIKTDDLLGKSHCREFAIPRKAAMYLCREKLKLPFQKIGEIFDRDHSTVMTSIDQIRKRNSDCAVLANLKF